MMLVRVSFKLVCMYFEIGQPFTLKLANLDQLKLSSLGAVHK